MGRRPSPPTASRSPHVLLPSYLPQLRTGSIPPVPISELLASQRHPALVDVPPMPCLSPAPCSSCRRDSPSRQRGPSTSPHAAQPRPYVPPADDSPPTVSCCIGHRQPIPRGGRTTVGAPARGSPAQVACCVGALPISDRSRQPSPPPAARSPPVILPRGSTTSSVSDSFGGQRAVHVAIRHDKKNSFSLMSDAIGQRIYFLLNVGLNI